MKILLAGYYGMRNFGDDLFVDTLVRRLPGQVACLAPPIRDVSAQYLVPRFLASAFAATDPRGGAVRALAAALLPWRRQVVVLGGGSLLHGQSQMIAILLRAARAGGGLVIGLGLSVGPFRDERARCRVAGQLGSMAGITLRDQLSMDEIPPGGCIPARLMGDVAALHPRFKGPYDHSGGPPLIVPCREVSAAEQVFAYVDASTEMGISCEPIVLSLNSHETNGDDDVALEVVHLLGLQGIQASTLCYSELGMGATMDLFSAASLVVSGRLHGAVVSYLFGRPFVLLPYHRKCIDFLDEIGYQGLFGEHLLTPSVYIARAEGAFQEALSWAGL